MANLFATTARRLGSFAGSLFRPRQTPVATPSPKQGTSAPVTDDDIEKGFRTLRQKIEAGREEVLATVRRTFDEPLQTFLAGGFVKVTSSNVSSIAYLKETRQLLILFHNGGCYQYDQVSEREATELFESSSKGGWVWDDLRVRGTVFGHKKPYRYLAAGSHGYAPKYTKKATWHAEHSTIPPSGDTPGSWKAGHGPYPPWYG